MERRRFLDCCAAGLAGTLCSHGSVAATELARGPAARASGLLIADPHAHPYQLHGSRAYDRSTPTIEIMEGLDMALCAFAAVGDMSFQRGRGGTPFNDTRGQLEQARRLAQQGRMRLVLQAADLAALAAPRQPTGGLLAVEGADALEGKLAHLDAFHADGVRLVTLLHERDNELGCNQRSSADGPLSRFGVAVVERMNRLGMVVDVAHARTNTLKGIAAVSAAPLIDSHTSPNRATDGTGSRRLRSWEEMELVAASGGVVCTWPLAYSGKTAQRTTLRDWAGEVVAMKARLGIAHCGLGTDGGGGLPQLIDGWQSIASLPALIEALREAGLIQDDIAAFVGGNFLRVLAKCLS